MNSIKTCNPVIPLREALAWRIAHALRGLQSKLNYPSTPQRDASDEANSSLWNCCGLRMDASMSSMRESWIFEIGSCLF
jgi:hypothetical protein